MWREIGMWLLILTVIFVFGQVCFHLVEGLLSKIKSLLSRSKEPPVWHTFEEAEGKTEESCAGQTQERRR